MLKDDALRIEKALNDRALSLKKRREELLNERVQCSIEFQEAGHEDARENAALEAAIEHMKQVNASMITVNEQINQLEEIADLSKYNSVGIVVLYSTVRLSCQGEEYIYRIFPNGISFIDIGVIAANSRLATAIMGRTAGDSVEIEHTSRNKVLKWTIEEVY